MKARLLSLMVACLLPLVGMSQDDSKNTIDIPTDSTDAHITPPLRDANTSLLPRISPSPQAEAFQKVGDYTVNNSSGMPDISIPLYEIDHCGYKIPLTLRYIATPLRPSYNYDVTGHGWTLSSGYCITRTIESVADEMANFRLNTQALTFYYKDYENSLEYFNFRYDQFHATLPGGASFSFYMRRVNDQLEYVISDRKQWKITCNYDTHNIYSFIVTDNTGVKYFFTKADYAIGVQNSHNVTWYLTKIELTNSTTPILFQYDQYIKQTTVASTAEPVLIIERYHLNGTSSGGGESSLTSRVEFPNTNTNYKMPLLSSISYGPTVISFTYQYPDNEREFNYLDKITISDNQTAVKKFHFTYNKQQHITYPIASLTRLVENGEGSETDSLVYAFSYTGVGSMQYTDHWGYCRNGVNYTDIGNFNAFFESDDSYQSTAGMYYVTAVPNNPLASIWYKKLKLYHSNVSGDPRQGADVEWHNCLTSITYPTGGRTEFVFEPHRFITATNAQGDYTAVKRNRQVIQGGGFRIKNIYNYTADGQLANARTFCYGPTYMDANNRHLNLPNITGNNSLAHIGFGEPVVDPNIITYTNFRNSSNNPFPIDEMLLGKHGYSDNGSTMSEFLYNMITIGEEWHWECRFSPLYFRSLLRGRNAVVYPEITEYYGDVTNFYASTLPVTGKTVYKYNIYNEMEDSVYTERIVYRGHVLDCIEDIGRRDLLTEKDVYRYDGTFHLQQKETYNYCINEQSPVCDYVFENIYTPYTENEYNIYTTIGSVMSEREIKFTYRNMTEKTDSFFTTTGAYANVESYEYDGNDLLTSSSTIANWYKSTGYAYPSASANAPEIERWLRSRNMMATVLQQKTRLAPNDTPMDVSGYKMDYAPFDFGDTLLLPKYLYRLNANYSGSSFEEIEQVKSYSANGNPLEVVDQGGMHTVYLWGYNDRYLIAEIKNATDSIVSAAVSSIFGMSITNLANANAPNTTHLKSLHTYAALGNAMITTWTYKPLVGVTSQTNPSGMTTYYDYDGLGRLKEVYRYEGNVVSASNKRILNQYNYHTKAQ